MLHYICTGRCGGVSDKPGTCQAEACEKHNEPLDICDCEGEVHAQFVAEKKNEDKKD